jgi:hypothetical protein
MATPTLAKSHESDRQQDGRLIERLTDLVEKVQKPKPPAPAPSGEPRQQDVAMLLDLMALGEKMAAQAIELRATPDPLLIALNGFPDVNNYYAYREGN